MNLSNDKSEVFYINIGENPILERRIVFKIVDEKFYFNKLLFFFFFSFYYSVTYSN